MGKFIKGTIFLAIIACLLWASAFAVIKIGLKYSAPLQFAGIRFILSGLMVLPLVKSYRTMGIYLRSHTKLILFISFLQTFVQYTLFYSGLNMVPAALGAIIVGSGPLFIAFTAHFLMPDDRLSWQKIGIIIMGIAGIALVSLSKASGGATNPLFIFGVLLLFLTNVNAGFTNVLIARDAKMIPPLVLSATSLIVGGVMLFIFSIPIEGLTFTSKPLPYYFALGWLSFLSAAAFSIWYTLLQRDGVKVSELNIWKFLTPVFGAILSWVLLPEESPDLISLSGILITAIALILFYRQSTSPVKQESII